MRQFTSWLLLFNFENGKEVIEGFYDSELSARRAMLGKPNTRVCYVEETLIKCQHSGVSVDPSNTIYGPRSLHKSQGRKNVSYDATGEYLTIKSSVKIAAFMGEDGTVMFHRDDVTAYGLVNKGFRRISE